MAAIRARASIILLAATLGGCGGGAATKPDEEALRNTVACQDGGERIVVRFDRGEVRLLLPGEERITLYQVPSGSGTRYTNGTLDLYGKGTELRLARNGGTPQVLANCAPLAPPP